MITDAETNVVYVSDLLESRYPELVGRLRGILSEHGIPLKVIRGTADIWVRDFMPIQICLGNVVRFRYTPDYLRDDKHLITDLDQLEPLAEIERFQVSDFVLDGGNVVGWGNRCIVTDKMFRENSGMDRDGLVAGLRGLLRVDHLIVIPREPYDVLGHADGVVRFLDEGTVAINDFTAIAPAYRERLLKILSRAGLNWAEVPYRPMQGRRGEIPPAFGNYLNFLRVQGLVVLPGYGLSEDHLARQLLAGRLPGTEIVTLECTKLSMDGGVLNCITWSAATGPQPAGEAAHRLKFNIRKDKGKQCTVITT